MLEQNPPMSINEFYNLCLEENFNLPLVQQVLNNIKYKRTFLTTKPSRGSTPASTIDISESKEVSNYFNKITPGLFNIHGKRHQEKDLRTAANILSVEDKEGFKFEGNNIGAMNIWLHEILNNDAKSNFNIKKLFAQAPDDLMKIRAGWHKHAIGIGFYKNFMLYCNTGGYHTDHNSGVIILPIIQTQKHQMLQFLAENLEAKAGDWFDGLSDILGNNMKYITHPKKHKNECIIIPKKPQKTGNCVKSNKTKMLEGAILLLWSHWQNKTLSIRDVQSFYENHANQIKKAYKQISTQLRKNAVQLIIEKIDLFERITLTEQDYLLALCANYYSEHSDKIKDKSKLKVIVFAENIAKIYGALKTSNSKKIQVFLQVFLTNKNHLVLPSEEALEIMYPNLAKAEEVFSDDDDHLTPAEEVFSDDDDRLTPAEEVFSDDESSSTSSPSLSNN